MTPPAGEVAFVSGAAGAVGSTAGQILKNLGLKVFGSAGTDDKVKLVKDLGFDDCFNYNTSDLDKELARVAPEGIDIFFDNVGGQTMEILLNHMRKRGRVICCGAISQYDKAGAEERYGVKNLFNIIAKSLKVQGFIVFDYVSEWPEGTAQLVGMVKDGKLKVVETIKEGFEHIPTSLLGLLTGANQGKMVIKT